MLDFADPRCRDEKGETMITKIAGVVISLAVVLIAACTQNKLPPSSLEQQNTEADSSPTPLASAEKPDLPCAYSSIPSKNSILKKQQFGYLTDMPEPVYVSLAQLIGLSGNPKQIRTAAPRLIAPPSGRWQETDVIIEDLPRWRFMGGVRSEKYWHIWMQTGGIGKTEHVFIIQPQTGTAKVHVKAHFMGLYEDLCPLVQVLERITFVGGTTERGEEWF